MRKQEQSSLQCYFTKNYKHLYFEESKDKPLALIIASVQENVMEAKLWAETWKPPITSKHTRKQWEELSVSPDHLHLFCTERYSGHRLIASTHFEAWKLKAWSFIIPYSK